jgi:hypothetical protein
LVLGALSFTDLGSAGTVSAGPPDGEWLFVEVDIDEDQEVGGTTVCFEYETTYVMPSDTGDTITVVRLVCYWSEYKTTRYGAY